MPQKLDSKQQEILGSRNTKESSAFLSIPSPRMTVFWMLLRNGRNPYHLAITFLLIVFVCSIFTLLV